MSELPGTGYGTSHDWRRGMTTTKGTTWHR